MRGLELGPPKAKTNSLTTRPAVQRSEALTFALILQLYETDFCQKWHNKLFFWKLYFYQKIATPKGHMLIKKLARGLTFVQAFLAFEIFGSYKFSC